MAPRVAYVGTVAERRGQKAAAAKHRGTNGWLCGAPPGASSVIAVLLRIVKGILVLIARGLCLHGRGQILAP